MSYSTDSTHSHPIGTISNPMCWLSSAYDIINSAPSFQSSNLHCSGRCLFKVTSYTSYNDVAEMKVVFLELLQFAFLSEAREIFSTQGLGWVFENMRSHKHSLSHICSENTSVSDVMWCVCGWQNPTHLQLPFLWCIQFSHSTFGKGRRNFVFSRLKSKIILLWFSSVRCSRLFFGWQLIKGSQLISVSVQKWTKLTSTSRLQAEKHTWNPQSSS